MLRSSLHMWMLWLLYTGTFSDEDIIGCEQQPCQNGGVCGSHDDGFRCLCSQQSQNGLLYGGVTCTTALSGCDGNQCENGGVCSPLLINNEHTYSCICLPGFTGPKCQTSTVFSFESRGYMFIETQLQDPEAPLNVTFSFRSERPVGTLLQRRVDDLLLSVELMDSHLRLWSVRGRNSSTLVQELPHYLTKNRWHTVEASLSGPVSLIRLICSEGSCTRYSSTEVQLLESAPALPKEPGPVGQSLFIGAGENQGSGRTLDKADQPSTFLGCLRDVFVGSQLLLPHIVTEDAQVNVTVGCSDKDKCADSPCQNRGRCVNRGWRSYICECHRPYEGGSCAEEYITARFGNKDLGSYALFSLDDDPGDSVSISMFIRTRQSSGLLLILANSTSQYLRLWLEDGRVKIQVNNFETLTGRGVVSDGHFHLVTVKMKEMEATIIQSTQNQGSIHIRPIQAHHGDLLFVGGLPDSRASASFGGYFKGCVQDLRLNRKRLQFYPIATPEESYSLERLTNVIEGCSSDDVCAVNPCLNGGMCYSMWDNFICNCPPNTAGKRCEEVKWCELSPCPASAVCQPQPQGFDCLSNLTFRAESSILHYQNNARINRSLASVSLRFRTRQPAAILLHGQKDSNYLTLSILDSRLVMELQSGAVTDSPKVTIQSQQPVSDGGWHIMELSMENQTLPNSRWIMVVNGCKEELSMSKSATGNLDFLKEGAEIFLGGQNPDTGVKLLGCLGPVEIGGLFFPFHQDTELNLLRPQEEQFMRTSNSNTPPLYGCSGAKVCEPNPCKNEGTCEDVFDLHHCTCPSDWTGPLCQDSTNACLSSPCLYGKCTNKPGGFKCVCEAHYSGDQCEVEVDVCLNSNCGNGSTCLKGFETYSCLCPHNLTGQYCDEKLPEIPWYIEINPLPRLPVSLCMGTKRKYSCFNGGNCSEADTCCCLPGFTGQWCEKDVDECASDPCMNGGFCLNYVNTFECVCDMNYSGIHCQVDISDFYLYVFLGLWQNLFQLVSYLVIRLDDEPEIEWGFEYYDD